ncbi:MAG: hypothetical protein CLLPBCKN_007259 [Chroococcidiopsis cubana SAG 39.79]|uniref:2OG-Fe dioxygenase family protein n=1 Tax=Chroococcidiopsis cubana SAG 39.79 TaxID=388085 RepID=A0AB37URP5_9CYAN|nr:2OG-Fe dioxygenase family protein [Chroococcidiopsis cubana]MDZ4877824.1 hypothetical protein [Chroococcidiopsis cubana SAG 39.79]PSB66264.1 hypothetical protein C7B79_01815 [Chroococcidiopsis cubana CCALA 043]RUT14101.1 hypothetical protein DSM107010_05840 [Chroococcidiopsis cubana SAG 39.79]
MRTQFLRSDYFTHSGVSLSGKNLINEQLTSDGFSWISGKQYCLTDIMQDSWCEMGSAWDRLVSDRYLSDGGSYRERRMGKYHFFPWRDCLEKQDVEGIYYQATSINTTNGGVKRRSGPLEESFANNLFLHNLIRLYYTLLPVPDEWHEQSWLVYVHPFRILAAPNMVGYPTPEGIHRDGHLFTVQVFVRKENVVEDSAESQIWSEDERSLLFAKTFGYPLDTLIINDERVKHCVSPLFASGSSRGTRDIFTINFNLLSNNSPTKMY